MTENPNRESLDSVLRSLLAQGRVDANTERLAREGVDKLRAFLQNEAPSPFTKAAQPPATQPAQPASEPAAPVATGTQIHTVPLAGGRTAVVELPARFTTTDADRIAAVLAALALDEDGA